MQLELFSNLEELDLKVPPGFLRCGSFFYGPTRTPKLRHVRLENGSQLDIGDIVQLTKEGVDSQSLQEIEIINSPGVDRVRLEDLDLGVKIRWA